jgi:hypothetical protein
VVKVKTDMPEDNQQPKPQPSQTGSTNNSGQVIQPTSSNVSPTSSQPQPYQPTTPISTNQIEQKPNQKRSKWGFLFELLGILQALGVGLFFLIILSISGQTGSEFIAMLLLVTLVPAVGLIAFINLVGLPIYMAKRKPRGRGLVFCILSLIISVVLASIAAYNLYQLRVTVPRHINELSEQSRQNSDQKQQEYAAANAKPEITKEEAISFIQNCKADYFVGYTDINLVKDGNTKTWVNKAEQSSTGIEISEGSPKSYVFASKSMTTALQDTARQFRQSCYNTKKLYITIDGWIETEYPPGKWTRVKQ